MAIEAVKYAPHPLAQLFPAMDADALRELTDDIKKQGLLEPIVLFEGKVLDGVHRQKACLMAGIEPHYLKFEKMNGVEATEIGALNFVTSRNLKRRHLNASQLAMLGADILPRFEAEAKKRQGKRTDLGTSGPNGPQVKTPERASEQAAEATGASGRQIRRAKALKRKSPAKAEKVRKGELTLSKAERDKAKEEAAKQARQDAIDRAEKLCGKGFADAIRRNTMLQGKQLAEWMKLDDAKIGEIRGLLVVGWKLKAALLFKSKKLTARHKLQDLFNATARAGFDFTVVIDGWRTHCIREARA